MTVGCWELLTFESCDRFAFEAGQAAAASAVTVAASVLTAAASAVAFAESSATVGGLVIAAAALGYAAPAPRVDAAAHLLELDGVQQI